MCPLGLEYVLGARERTQGVIRSVVLEDAGPFTLLCIGRADGEATQLFVKQVTVGGKRYIVYRNEAEAAKDAANRAAVIAALERQLARGDKGLIGNSAYRRFLRRTANRRAFEIDPGKVAEGDQAAQEKGENGPESSRSWNDDKDNYQNY